MHIVREVRTTDGHLLSIVETKDDGVGVKRTYSGDPYEYLVEEHYLVDGKRNGTSSFFCDITGVKLSTEEYVAGLKEGETTEYNYSGELIKTYRYEGGLRHGKAKVYGYKGKVMAVNNYTKDKLNGNSISFNPDGSIFSVTPYVDGVIHGTRKLVSKDSVDEYIYINGVQQ